MQIYKVGGFVRDHLLSIESNDIDWVVVGTCAQQMLDMGFTSVGKDFPVFLHPDTKEEYALARKEVKRGIGYHGFEFEVDSVSLEEDLYRRDITINAIAMDDQNVIFDPYGGKKDLHSKTIVHVSDHFREDPLRVLRVARFQAKLPNFRIHESTMLLMADMVKSGELDSLTPERISIEMYKALKCPKPSLFFETLRKVGALEIIFPEIHNLIDVPQTEKYHPEGCAYTHTMCALDLGSSSDLKIKLSILVHDLGKAATPKEKLPRHPGHDALGIPLVKAFCDRLKISKEHSRFCYLVTKYHILSHIALELRPIKIIRMLRDMRALHQPEVLYDFISACKADCAGKLRGEFYPQGDYLISCLRIMKETSIKEITKEYEGINIADQIDREYSRGIKVLKKQWNLNRFDEILIEKHNIIDRMETNHPDKKLIGLIIAGSHFFNMDSPTSDLDFRGIYLPYNKDTRKGQLTYKTSDDKSKNNEDDVDVDLYSIYKFLKLISKGDFNMIEFLFAPQDKILVDSALYKWLRSIKHSFLTKNIGPFIGFIKKEYNRYGISGDHYNAQLKLLDFMKDWDPMDKLLDHWQELIDYSKEELNLVRISKSMAGKNEWVDSIVIAHRMFQGTVRINYMRKEIESKLKRYGHRKKDRKDGADCKGLYHAKRLIFEAKDIVTKNKIDIPFSQDRHNELKKIRSGEMNIDALGESINKDIEFLRSYDYTDEGRAEYVRDLASRIILNIKSEVEIYNLINSED